ncbi:MAG: PA2169 family four-helix-bundle protein [Betaproteobacteria bacterium]
MASDTASVLNELVETSKDGEKGFRTAAEDTKNAELKEIFSKRAQDCGKGASELQALVARMGEKPEDGGSVSGAVHRGWVNLKAAVSVRDDLAILEECERGEDVAKAAYRDALTDESLPADIRTVVQKQYDGVVRNHDQIRDLRDRYRAAKR